MLVVVAAGHDLIVPCDPWSTSRYVAVTLRLAVNTCRLHHTWGSTPRWVTASSQLDTPACPSAWHTAMACFGSACYPNEEQVECKCPVFDSPTWHMKGAATVAASRLVGSGSRPPLPPSPRQMLLLHPFMDLLRVAPRPGRVWRK
ncbi:hypothetical protein JOF35_000210 [Streptomyces demainii]|uniref:Uncharacterized protein n=1 Tax=Streptomyces demainii TaxID=588122 RepID=A0ABT9KHN2_9ACTN|nr:hypothetical protein [Streptomyces demainii]